MGRAGVISFPVYGTVRYGIQPLRKSRLKCSSDTLLPCNTLTVNSSCVALQIKARSLRVLIFISATGNSKGSTLPSSIYIKLNI